jgi:succinate dehydrogenase / fumarate reductase cytochrome b subunit
MTSVATFAGSSVGKKVLVAITGLMLFGFVIVHLVGNLTLFIPDGGEAFNQYAHFLETLIHGWLIIGFEIGLIAITIVHVVYAIIVALVDKERARPDKYAMIRNAGGKSHKSLASRFMIITGPIILIFAILHVRMFKFAPELQNTAHGEIKDLYGVVDRAFSVPWIVAAYMIVMVLLGTHLWHGVWSALQSLGLNSDRHIKLLTRLSMLAGVVLGIGFLVLPLYMYFTGPGGH